MSTVNVNPTSNTITVIDNGTQIITVNTQGPQGPAGTNGEPGASGSQGPSGSTDVPTGTVSGSTQISLLGFVTSSATASFAITGSDVIFASITSSGDISASATLFVKQIDMHDSQNTQINMYKDGSLNTSLNSRGNVHSFIEASGSAANLGVGTNVPTEKLTVEGNISASGTVIAGAVTTTGNISSSAGYLYGERVFADRGFINNLAADTLYGGDGANTAITLNAVAGLSLLGPVTASGNISSSGTVTALTGSFGTITGLSPITVTDSITFQQPITASIISASTFSGDGSGLANVPESTDINVYLNFEEARSFAYIVPYNLQFAGFTTSSAMTVQISSSGAPYVFTSSLSQFSTLSVTSSAAGLVTLSGSKL